MGVKTATRKFLFLGGPLHGSRCAVDSEMVRMRHMKDDEVQEVRYRRRGILLGGGHVYWYTLPICSEDESRTLLAQFIRGNERCAM